MPPPGTYTYISSGLSGTNGHATVLVKANGTGFELDETSSATFAGIAASASATLTLGLDLAPVAYTASYARDGSKLGASLTFDGALAKQSGSVATALFTLDATTKHFVVIDGPLLAGYLALPAQLTAWSDAPVLAIAPVLGASFALAPDAGAHADRPGGVPPHDVALQLHNPVQLAIWYDPATLVVDEIDAPTRDERIVRASGP